MYLNTGYLNHSHMDFKDKSRVFEHRLFEPLTYGFQRQKSSADCR